MSKSSRAPRLVHRAVCTLTAGVLLIVACALPGSAQDAGTALRTPGLGRAAVPVDGEWQFHPGDNPLWASPAFDDSRWQTIETGRPWEGQGHRDLTGFAWYRRHIVLPERVSPGWTLALLLSNVEDAAEVYWNGRLVGSFGKVPPGAVWYEHDVPGYPASLAEIGAATDQPRDNVLAIRVWKAPYAYLSDPDMGGLTRTPVLGSDEALQAIRTAAEFDWLRSHLYSFAITLLSAIISMLALLGWLRSRGNWMLFWLAVFTFRPVALLLSEQLPWTSWRSGYGTAGIIYSSTDAALWFLLLYLFELRGNERLVRWTVVCTSIAVGCQLLEGSEQLFDWTRAPHFFLHADVGLTIPSLTLEVWPIVLVLFAVRKRLDAARWMVAVFAILANVISNSVSWFDLGNRWTHWTIARRIMSPMFVLGGNEFNALTIASTLLLLSILFAVWRYEQDRTQRQVHLDEEFRNAQELQQLLIPESLPALPGIAISSAYRPAQEVGGDFFQLIPLWDNSALLILGDVSGKGLHAAMTVALIVGAVRSLAETSPHPAHLLSSLNRRLHGRLRNGFATCLVLRLHADGSCLLANAGHLPPFVNGDELQLPSALPLGLVQEVEYESVDLQLAPGDRITLYTDGVLEARNSAGELFGFSRVAGLLAQPLDAGQVAQAAQQFGQEDDITVLTLCWAPVAAMA